jgi:hypothetical protein
MNVTVGPPQVLPHGQLGNWPDGLVGKRFFRLTSLPVLWASNGGNLAYMVPPFAATFRYPRPKGLPADIGYCSGGPILTSPVDGSWIMVNHAERYTAPQPPRHMWSTVELTRSTDDGHTWNYLGCVIEPFKRFSTANTQSCEIAGGAVCYVGEDLHFYFREPQDDYKGRAGMATVNAWEFFTDIANGILPQVMKLGDNPAVGRYLSNQLPGLPIECNWQDVVYVADKRIYLMAFCPFGDTEGFKGKGIYFATSLDGYDWTPQSKQSVVNKPGAVCYYPNFVSLDYDERFVLSNRLQLMYLSVVDLVNVWPGSELCIGKVNL